jgi:hypothetical protein
VHRPHGSTHIGANGAVPGTQCDSLAGAFQHAIAQTHSESHAGSQS